MPLTGTQLSVQLIPNNLYKSIRSNVTVVERNAYLEANVFAIGPGVTGINIGDTVMFSYTAAYAAQTGVFTILQSIVTDVENTGL